MNVWLVVRNSSDDVVILGICTSQAKAIEIVHTFTDMNQHLKMRSLGHNPWIVKDELSTVEIYEINLDEYRELYFGM